MVRDIGQQELDWTPEATRSRSQSTATMLMKYGLVKARACSWLTQKPSKPEFSGRARPEVCTPIKAAAWVHESPSPSMKFSSTALHEKAGLGRGSGWHSNLVS